MIICANCTYPIVIPVALEELFAKREETEIWEDVIFQNDPFRLLIEKPINSRNNCITASKVMGLKLLMKLTRPINESSRGSLQQCAHLCATLSL